jgi:predicted nuclease of predicted toxin-antitoxin system
VFTVVSWAGLDQIVARFADVNASDINQRPAIWTDTLRMARDFWITGQAPSVVQLRAQDLLSEAAVSVVVSALVAHREEVDGGSLLSIDEGGTRLRMLPLRRP